MLFPVLNVLYFHVDTFHSSVLCPVWVFFCSSLISCFLGMLLSYTVQSISFRTFFFLITELKRSIGQPTKYYQPTSIHTPSFVCLSLTVCEFNLSCKVSFVWMVEMSRELP